MEIEELAVAIQQKRVRLEIGNKEHIAAMKYLKKLAKENKMNKYRVTLEYSATIISVQDIAAVG